MPSAHGTLDWSPVEAGRDLLAPPTAAVIALTPSARVAAIDDALADTAAFCAAYDVALESSANCVIVSGRRGEVTKHAAVLVLATDRADINGVVRRHLDVRKISFAPREEATGATDMEFGGITPIGLPAHWPILIDEAVAAAGPVVIGSGLRRSKILVEATDLVTLPGAEVLALASPR
jgi:prolyl-tRNA editing enzyme YbaK/EbsC (Cys-tRNA(Pro) deacylase)